MSKVLRTSSGKLLHYSKPIYDNDINNGFNTIVSSNKILKIGDPKWLELTFDNILNAPVSNPSQVSEWNVFFDLPTYGSVFNAVKVVGNMVKLYGGSNIIIKPYLFFQNHSITSISDKIGCIVELGEGAFYESQNVTFSLNYLIKAGKYAFNSTMCEEYNFPLLEEIGFQCFYFTTNGKRYIFNNLLRILDESVFSYSLIEILYIPKLTNLGSSVGMNYIFYAVSGRTIMLTIPTTLMTCNAGNPDGDIQYLIDNNTVTIYDPDGNKIYPI